MDAILDVAARADRDGRWKDEIRLARSVVTLLALVPRWIALAKTLQRALAAAEALRDGSAAAWAHHEAGTFALGAGDAHAATRHLGEALRLRGALGEEAAAELTRHNLELVATVATDGQLEPVRRAGRLSRLGRRGLVGAILAGGVLLLAGGLALAEAIGDRATIGELRTSDATDARDVYGETRTGQPATETDRTVQTEDTTAAARPDLAVDATPTGFTIANVGDADASEFDVTVSGLEPQRSRGLEAGGSVSADLGCEEKPREVAVDPLENPDADPTNDVDVSEPCSDLAVANEPGPGGFIVKNVGGSDAGAFAVDVRGVDTFVFDGLRVGESVEDAVECVEGTPSAVVDPDNEVPELDEANNSIDLGCPDVD